MRPSARPNEERTDPSETKFLVIWWMSKNPYAALFTNRVAAEAAANVRNALLVTIKGRGTDIDEVLDWYRRDEKGRPMPAEWRELMGHLHLPWHAKPHAHSIEHIGAISRSGEAPAEA